MDSFILFIMARQGVRRGEPLPDEQELIKGLSHGFLSPVQEQSRERGRFL
jgi:hypothetical protein